MLDDFRHWWTSGWEGRAMVLFIAAAPPVFIWLIYDAAMAPARWERFKIDHHCYIMTAPVPGQFDPGWKCDDGILYYRK